MDEQTTFQKWYTKSKSIPGWLTEPEAKYLWEIATQSTKGHILEIGTWRGRSTCILAGACVETAPKTKVICIDPFRVQEEDDEALRRDIGESPGTFYDFMENAQTLGFINNVIPVPALSWDIAGLFKRQFRMAFVDGRHDYECVSKDIKSVMSALAQGGVITLHDAHNSNHPGVMKAVKELLSQPKIMEVGRGGSIVAAKAKR